MPERIAVLVAISACHALATIASSPCAASAPTTPAISPNRRPCTASAPKKMLATAMMITSVGASENAAKNAIDAENITQWSWLHCVTGSTIQDHQACGFDVRPVAGGGVVSVGIGWMEGSRAIFSGWGQLEATLDQALQA